tara:strand:+ start:1432 stop:1614 length:183 start_codon:yes stop_codon:yes gene_type:complete
VLFSAQVQALPVQALPVQALPVQVHLPHGNYREVGEADSSYSMSLDNPYPSDSLLWPPRH